MDIIGPILLVVGVVGLAFIIYTFIRDKKQGGISQYVPPREEKVEILPTDRSGMKPEDRLKEVRSKQTITLAGEGERSVLASVALHEMTQTSKEAPWSRTGNVSKGLVLSKEIFIFKVPGREGGQPKWLRAQEIETYSLKQFYRGKDEESGPAKQFHLNGQITPVPYQLPGGLTPGVTWKVVDIGTFDVGVDGESGNFVSGDRLYFVTSIEEGGMRWLLYLDARKGEAKGSGGLFIGEPFEPSVEVSDLL
ncbi:MAG: hypothetical protein WCX17_02550 [Parcubacteria group bacterium]|jgi:hypothetical protein